MLISSGLTLLIIIICVTNLRSEKEIKIIENGGYTARFCFNSSETMKITNVEKNRLFFKCQKSNHTRNDCKNQSVFLCPIPCNFTETNIKINGFKKKIKYMKKSNFGLKINKPIYYLNENLTIVSDDSLSLLMDNEINIHFSSHISCSQKYIQNKAIICTLNSTKISFNEAKSINVSVSFGNTCTTQVFVKSISFLNASSRTNFILFYIISILSILIVTCVASFVFLKLRNTKSMKNEVTIIKKSLQNQNIEFSDIQIKAFKEYEMAINSLSNIGKFTNRHLHSFHYFMTKLFNVKFDMMLEEHMTSEIQSFKDVLLNKNMLIEWIEKVETSSKVQNKCLVASFLTIYLFYHPKYFIEVIKTLLRRQIIKLKENSEENLLFCHSESIVEKVVCHLISLCLYQSIIASDIGETFFNLYRGIKCKLDSGIVDMFNNNAKYKLSFDNLLMDDFTAKQLTIFVNVKIQIRLMDPAKYPMEIDIHNLEVEVLSLDSISQVKLKIIDKAILKYGETYENIYEFESTIATICHKEYHLHYHLNNTLVNLNDFDSTNRIFHGNNTYIMVNTMKHYNINSGQLLFLGQECRTEFSSPSEIINQSTNLNNCVYIHVQLPQNITIEDRRKLNKKLFGKSMFNSFVESTNKNSCLFTLLATKKTLDPLIYGFFNSIMKRKEKVEIKNSLQASLNKCPQTDYVGNVLYGSDCNLAINNYDNYFKISYFLFSLFDDIGNSLSINRHIIKCWKNRCFILQIWVNIIKNADFIFSFNKTQPIHESLITIAKVLMESCSKTSNKNLNESEFPQIKQLFIKDIDKYSLLWQEFNDNYVHINEEEMILIMTSIMEKNFLNSYKIVALKNLHFLSNFDSLVRFQK